MTPLARGRRVSLHAPTARDRDAFLDAVSRSRTLHGRWVSPPSNAAEFSDHLRRVRKENAAGFLARRHQDGALVGALTLSQIVRDPFRSAYLGYYAFAPYQGLGLMTEAIDLTLRQAFGPLHLHRVEANVQPGNAASIALVRRRGFRLEGYSPRYLKVAGRWRDHERWAITSEDRRRP